MKEKPNYYSIIPANVRYDPNLKPNEKLLYGEITSLSNKEGYCWATNSYFAELYNVKAGTVSEWISNLANHGYIETTLIRNEKTKEVEKRIISITSLENMPTSGNIGYPYTENIGDPIRQKPKENNTRLNNTSTNKDIVGQASTMPIKEIVSYLNEKTGASYRPTTPSTKKLIQSRIKEGFTEEDFYKVIDTKTSEWLKDSQMKKYLRPQTLFGTKFEAYLNEGSSKNTVHSEISKAVEQTKKGWSF